MRHSISCSGKDQHDAWLHRKGRLGACLVECKPVTQPTGVRLADTVGASAARLGELWAIQHIWCAAGKTGRRRHGTAGEGAPFAGRT